MKDIARIAGVSVMTVSRSLRDDINQSQQTRDRIRKIATDLGYHMHPYVSSLMSNVARSRPTQALANLAAFHFPLPDNKRLGDYYAGIEQRTASLGYHIEPFAYTTDETALKRLKSILRSRGIRGIIVLPALEGQTQLDFDFAGFASCAIGDSIHSPTMPRVTLDSFRETIRAMDIVIRRGYRRIGLITSDYVGGMSLYQYSGAFHAIAERERSRVRMRQLNVHSRDSTSPLSKKEIRQMLKWIRDERLDAVVSPVFDFPLFQYLTQNGLRIPEDLGYLHLFHHSDPGITQIKPRWKQMGSKAVDVVVAAIQRNELHQQLEYSLTTPLDWHEGETLPDRRGIG